MNTTPMHLSILSEADDVVSLKLSGKVTQRNLAMGQDPLDEALGNQRFSRPMLWDLSEVEVLDSSGVNWLLISQKRIRESGGRIVLHSISPTASNVLRILNLHTIFTLADNEAQAHQLALGAAS